MFRRTELNETYEERNGKKTEGRKRENRDIWVLCGEQRKQAYQWQKPLSEIEMESVSHGVTAPESKRIKATHTSSINHDIKLISTLGLDIELVNKHIFYIYILKKM